MKMSLPIVRKLDTKIFRQKLIEAYTNRTYRRYKSGRTVMKFTVYGKSHREEGPAHYVSYPNGEYEEE